jgi:two-component system, OmpR family, response regulator VicR
VVSDFLRKKFHSPFTIHHHENTALMNEKILLVDDNNDLLMITQIILKGQGYETVLARSLEEAEKKMKIHHPALVLLDVCLGAEDGRMFCCQLKSANQSDPPRVILMSGDDCIDYADIEADDFLSKPFDFNQLLAKVENQFATIH